MSMTRLADELLWQALGQLQPPAPVLHLHEEEPAPIPCRETDAA